MNMKKIWNFVRNDLWIFILDIVAVNLAYFLALIIRFYVNGEFRTTVSYYMDDWAKFAPFYTVIALVIFFCCRMYGGMWKYAGLNDMNRIITANVLTTVVMVAGTLIFIRRMPVTYYFIGALLQFIFTGMIRFAYRILLAEKKKMTRTGRIPALVIGSGDLGKKTIQYLEESGVYQPVGIIGRDVGRSLDGIPVTAFDDLKKSLEKVKAVFIADKEIDPKQRKAVNDAAEGREVFDYTGALSNITGAVPLTGLLETVTGPVVLSVNGQETRYANGKEALSALHTRYLVTEIRGEKLTVELVEDDGTAYLKQHMAETGEELSFF